MGHSINLNVSLNFWPKARRQLGNVLQKLPKLWQIAQSGQADLSDENRPYIIARAHNEARGSFVHLSPLTWACMLGTIHYFYATEDVGNI